MLQLDEALALQALIDGGHWGLPGRAGRAMMDAINAGDCMLGPVPVRDAYGSPVPARHMIRDGAPGSRGHVVATRGEEWAAALEAGDLPDPVAALTELGL